MWDLAPCTAGQSPLPQVKTRQNSPSDHAGNRKHRHRSSNEKRAERAQGSELVPGISPTSDRDGPLSTAGAHAEHRAGSSPCSQWSNNKVSLSVASRPEDARHSGRLAPRTRSEQSSRRPRPASVSTCWRTPGQAPAPRGQEGRLEHSRELAALGTPLSFILSFLRTLRLHKLQASG